MQILSGASYWVQQQQRELLAAATSLAMHPSVGGMNAQTASEMAPSVKTATTVVKGASASQVPRSDAVGNAAGVYSLAENEPFSHHLMLDRPLDAGCRQPL